MDQDARYIGLGLAFDSLVTALGQFRSLSQNLARQLEEKERLIKELQDKAKTDAAETLPVFAR